MKDVAALAPLIKLIHSRNLLGLFMAQRAPKVYSALPKPALLEDGFTLRYSVVIPLTPSPDCPRPQSQ